ncbi:hypothetical protein BLNAU_5987 [Blattamonas nauphoetae]|uniref:Uncharacterized protein n=1 Tax=Blattamonas nauphoetae TaxID=2049346 RepID=A0ABQ9Y5F0_9EUKA|nr:hypothetical protein BLNAU_5987 [Blattamonas nauphoetae]
MKKGTAVQHRFKLVLFSSVPATRSITHKPLTKKQERTALIRESFAVEVSMRTRQPTEKSREVNQKMQEEFERKRREIEHAGLEQQLIRKMELTTKYEMSLRPSSKLSHPDSTKKIRETRQPSTSFCISSNLFWNIYIGTGAKVHMLNIIVITHRRNPGNPNMGHPKSRTMFFLFALLSASSFRSPNLPSDPPVHIELADLDAGAGTVNLKMTFAGRGDVVAGQPMDLGFGEQPYDEEDPVGVLISIPEATSLGDDKIFTHTITDLGKSFLYGKSYTLMAYRHMDEYGTEDCPTDVITIGKLLNVTLTASSKSTYTLKCEVAANVNTATTLTVKFTAGTTTISKDVVIAESTKVKEVEIDVVTTAAENKLLAGTEYTISCERYEPTVTKFIPADNNKLTGESSLVKEGEKEDGAKDKVTVTLRNALLPAEAGLPQGYTQKLTLKDTAPAKANGERKLDKSDKFKWTHAAGSVAVEYLFKDCPIKKGSTVSATLVISDELTFEDQPITYDAGAKSVASAVAALVAVLALVF